MSLNDAIASAEQRASQGDLAGAIAAYRDWRAGPGATGTAQERYVTWHNEAVLHMRAAQPASAMAAWQQAVAELPDSPEAHTGLMSLWCSLGLPSHALQHVQQALLLSGDANLQAHLRARLQQVLALLPGPALRPKGPWAFDGPQDDPDTQRVRADVAQQRLLPRFHHRMAARQRYNRGTRPLRVGYMAATPAHLPAPALHHDPARVEALLFTWDKAGSALPAGAPRGGLPAHHSLHDLIDDAAASAIRLLQVDVLLDVHGLAAEGRPGILVYHPAPLQLVWTDAAGDAALAAHDVCLGDDAWPWPAGAIWVPDALPTPATPAARTGLVWGSCLTATELGDDLAALWLRLLAGQPGSRLRLWAPETGLVQRLQQRATAQGLPPEAIEAAADADGFWTGLSAVLDPAPSRWPRLAAEAVARGVPVVTLQGRGAAARQGAQLLARLGLAATGVAADLSQYEALAGAAVSSAAATPRPEALAPLRPAAWMQALETRLLDAVAALPPRPVAPPASPAELAALRDLHDFTLPGPGGAEFRRRYVIGAPPHEHNSAGIRVLYDLQKWLVRAGYDALVCTYSPDYPKAQFVDDIVIYPEVAPGNLLNAKRIVRYVMNTPGKLGRGERSYAADEFLVAYNQQLAPYADGRVLEVPSIEPWFYDPGAESPRDVDVFYVGKGRNTGHHPPDALEITKTWPPTRREMAALLRRARRLYCYDGFTIMVREAWLCGCEPIHLLPDGTQRPFAREAIPTVDEFKQQLHAFIIATQAL